MGEPAEDTSASESTVLSDGPMNLNPSRGKVGDRMPGLSGPEGSPGSPINLNPARGPVGVEISPAEQTRQDQMRGAGMDPFNPIDRALAALGKGIGLPPNAKDADPSSLFGALTGTLLTSIVAENIIGKFQKDQREKSRQQSVAKASTTQVRQAGVATSQKVGPARSGIGLGGDSSGTGVG